MTDDENIPSGLNLKSSNVALHAKTVELVEEMFEHVKTESFFCESLRKKSIYQTICIRCDKLEGCSQAKTKEEALETLEWLLDINEENQ